MRDTFRRFACLSLLLILAAAAQAQWSNDPAENNSIADRPAEQAVPKVATAPDGSCYVAWFDQASGNYDVYLQHLTAIGNEVWAHNGIPVSTHPQNSSLVDWDLIADSAGNAVLVFTDARDGSDLDVHAYMVGSDGAMLWGPDGLTLSSNADYEPNPRVVETSDGSFAFIWARMPDVGEGTIRLQRISPAGMALLPENGVPIVTGSGESPGFTDLVAAADGSVILTWIRDISFSGNRHLRAERFDGAGASLWGGHVEVYDQISLPIAYQPVIQPDGVGGALLLWHRSLSNLYNSLVQHLDAAGNELFPHNGITVSTVGGMHHISPTLAPHEPTGDIYVFWDERNSSQSQWGVFGQRFDALGARLWGNGGREFLPTDTLYKYAIRALPLPDTEGGAMVFWVDEPGGWGQDRIRGFGVDSDGDYTWDPDPILVSSTLSGKSRLPVAQAPDGTAILIWEDDRAGTRDVYGQNVDTAGYLGGGDTGVEVPGAASAAPFLDPVYPNPFNPSTTLRFRMLQDAHAQLVILDTRGRRIATLADDFLRAGSHEKVWDGRDDAGRAQPSGVYFGQLRVAGKSASRPLILLK